MCYFYFVCALYSFNQKVPPLQDAIRSYVRAKYGQCLTLLQRMKVNWDLDMCLSPHVKELWTMVRDKCIVQYFSANASVSLQNMMDSFGSSTFTNLDQVESIVADLIFRKKIVGARINGVEQKLTCWSDSSEKDDEASGEWGWILV